MSAKAIASFCIAAASFVAGLAIPIAFPELPQWMGFVGLASSALLFLMGTTFTVRERRRRAVEVSADPHKYLRDDIERARLEAEKADVLVGLEFRRGLAAYSRGEPRAPDPQAHIGTPGAALFGLDSAESRIVIDFKNFGQGVARGVKGRAVAGWYETQPTPPIPYETAISTGVIEPGHTQNITLILTRPVTSSDIAKIERGGRGIYALAEIEYTDARRTWRTRHMAYYLDPQGQRRPDRWMLSVCATGNDETEGSAE